MMLASARAPLGAPGVYTLPDVAAPRLAPQRMDVCAFVGVAPRGPAYVPVVDESHPDGWRMIADLDRPRRRSVAVAVESFDDYRRLYGAFEGPGLLPYAVAAFFDQGGRRAYVVRIVAAQAKPVPDGAPPQPPNLAGLALGEVKDLFTDPLQFYARNEGSWGGGLRVDIGFTPRALAFGLDPAGTVLVDDPGLAGAGTLLRFGAASGAMQLVYCRGVRQLRAPDAPLSRWALELDAPLALAPVRADIVEAWIEVRDDSGRAELFDRLGLSPAHPRSLAGVLCNESTLVWPHYNWAGAELVPRQARVELLRAASGPFENGKDSYEALAPGDFFDDSWSAAEDSPGAGVTALAGLADLTHVVAPDLYVPAQWAGLDVGNDVQTSQAGAEFGACVRVQSGVAAHSTPPSAMPGLILDPRSSAGLRDIGALQQKLVDFCEQTQDAIALVDVPPGLSQGQAERWRAGFDSGWCAAYHPWLRGARRAGAGGRLLPLPPSAVAAGIIARKELLRGIQYGPANELAAEVVDVAEPLTLDRIARFHPLGLNCFERAADGIRLVAARTLSRDPQWRQLSVRRLVLMIRRTLLRETAWAVFEPNGPALWADLRHAIENLLRGLFRAGAFAPASEDDAFFVRVRNEPRLLDAGEVIFEIGIAPAEPIEFILIRLRRGGDGTLTLEHG